MGNFDHIDVDACVRKAILERRPDIVQKLLRFDIDINQLRHGYSFLHESICIGRNAEIIRYLISKGADINLAAEDQGDTPFLMACMYGNLPLAELLLHHGANPFSQNNFGQKCLNYAAIGDFQVLKWLLSMERFSLNHRDVEGNSILHGYIRNTYHGPVRMSLECPNMRWVLIFVADTEIKNFQGRPASYSCSCKNKNLCMNAKYLATVKFLNEDLSRKISNIIEDETLRKIETLYDSNLNAIENE